jgi:hypothetical protein
VAVQLQGVDGQPVTASVMALTYWGGCFLDLTGAPHCWGGHLVSDFDKLPLPTAMTTATGEVIQGTPLAASWEETCMTDADGNLWCWGDGCIRGQDVEVNTLEQVFLPAHLDGTSPQE